MQHVFTQLSWFKLPSIVTSFQNINHFMSGTDANTTVASETIKWELQCCVQHVHISILPQGRSSGGSERLGLFFSERRNDICQAKHYNKSSPTYITCDFPRTPSIVTAACQVLHDPMYTQTHIHKYTYTRNVGECPTWWSPCRT